MRPTGIALVAALACVAGCAGMRLRQEVGAVGRVIGAARANGAEVCAPIELALAESHHDFAGVELDEGDYYRARQELLIAEQNAHDALRKSPRGKCGKVAAAPGDREYCLPTCGSVDHFPRGGLLFGSRDWCEAIGLEPCTSCRPDLHPLAAR